jgi:hypothetical protein
MVAEDDLDGSESERLPSGRSHEAVTRNGIRIMGHSFDNRVSHRHDGDHFPGHPSTAKRDHLDLGREFAWTRASARAEMGLAHTESWIGVSATFSDADPDSNQQNHQTAHHLLALHRELSWQIPRTKIGIMAHLPNGTKAPIAKLCATFDSVEVVETETQLFQSLCAADSWILIETPSCPESIVLAEALIDVADAIRLPAYASQIPASQIPVSRKVVKPLSSRRLPRFSSGDNAELALAIADVLARRNDALSTLAMVTSVGSETKDPEWVHERLRMALRTGNRDHTTGVLSDGDLKASNPRSHRAA